MMKLWRSSGVAVVVVVVVLAMLEVKGSWAQDAACLNQLVACMPYLDGRNDVPDSCCDPLKSVIKSKPQCLCALISNEGSTQAEQAGINVTEAQQLPGKCGQHVNPLTCLKGSSSSGSKSSMQDSSASVLLMQSKSLMVAMVLAVTLQILWVSITV
ncbi:lipid transfer-like protein VAS [Pistacia vera]|uniref:lipid transfer-like protein VAS n=1 Tax=Pistacia vera TaxID=55513 RepID=UPI0012636D17|nr:lipid transfer-like protein VAS [Pistacia vera]